MGVLEDRTRFEPAEVEPRIGRRRLRVNSGRLGAELAALAEAT